MILLVAVAIGLLSAPLLGGRLSRIADLRLRCQPLLMAALVLQVTVAGVAGLPELSQRGGHVASYLLAAGFVWANRHLRGVLALGMGGGLNGAAIAANGGVMPASAEAVRSARLTHAAGEFHNSAVVADANLGFLGDVFAMPAALPLANVFSLGDVVLFGAGIALVHGAAGASWRKGRDRARLGAACAADFVRGRLEGLGRVLAPSA